MLVYNVIIAGILSQNHNGTRVAQTNYLQIQMGQSNSGNAAHLLAVIYIYHGFNQFLSAADGRLGDGLRKRKASHRTLMECFLGLCLGYFDGGIKYL